MTASYRVQFVAHLIQADYTEYHIKVTSSNGESWLIRRRYSEFRELHDHLRLKYGEQLSGMPGKRLWGNQDPNFVKERQDGLQRYMDGVLGLDAECRTKFLRRFLEIREAQALSHSPANLLVSPQLASTSALAQQPSAATVSVASLAEAKRRIIATCEERLFNLSTSVGLIDGAEEAQRKKKYQDLFARLSELDSHSSSRLPPYRPPVSFRASPDATPVIDVPVSELILPIDVQ